MLCTAQTINISGIVKDTAGVGISGATVKLEVADILTTTGADGRFTLTNNQTQIQQGITSRRITANPIQIQNGKFFFTLYKNTNVVISIHDISGRRIYNSSRTYGSGAHAIVVPLQATGIFIYKVNIGNETYSFKSSSFGTFSTERNAALGNSSSLAKQSKTTAAFADVISVVKEGQINYRDSIKTSDTTSIVVKMIPNAGNVTDADGNVYQSVRLGKQVWTVENLKTTKYNDGSAIPNVTNYLYWDDLTTDAYCYYVNNAVNKVKYGALYNWYAVNTGKLAPEGWRVPTDAEWDTLQNYLIANGYNWDGKTIGNKIAKSMAAQTDWITCTYPGSIGNDLSKNNASGFSALPGGCRDYDGYFASISLQAYWWSATEIDTLRACYRSLKFNYVELFLDDFNYKVHGFSVRLLRD
jgi:uncharacterized protein (TIGR02145 family)